MTASAEACGLTGDLTPECLRTEIKSVPNPSPGRPAALPQNCQTTSGY